MKGLIINIQTTISLNITYLLHISYILYDFTKCKILLTQTYDIELYHNAHKYFYNNSNDNSNNNSYLIENNIIRKIIPIINYYIRLSNIIIAYDYEHVKDILVQEAHRNNIQCDLELNEKKTYCILTTYYKINFSLQSIEENENYQLLYNIYECLFNINYSYCSTRTLLNCILIIRIYYKFIVGDDIEKYDFQLLRLRLLNS